MNHAGKQTLTALSFSLWLNCTPSFSIHHQQHFCHPSYALLCNRKIFQKVYIKHGCFSIHTESTRWIYIMKVHIKNNFPEDIVSFRIHIQTYEKCKILKANLYFTSVLFSRCRLFNTTTRSVQVVRQSVFLTTMCGISSVYKSYWWPHDGLFNRTR